MTIKLQLKPEIEAQLIAQANAQGISVETYLESLIEQTLISNEEKPLKSGSTVPLIAQANAQAILVKNDQESLVQHSLISYDEKPFYETATQEEWEALLVDLIDSPVFTVAPQLSDEAISRESIYSREDEM